MVALFIVVAIDVWIVIAHRLSTVRRADQILVIEKGKIIEQGSHDQLIGVDQGTYAHLYSLQSGEASA